MTQILPATGTVILWTLTGRRLSQSGEKKGRKIARCQAENQVSKSLSPPEAPAAHTTPRWDVAAALLGRPGERAVIFKGDLKGHEI